MSLSLMAFQPAIDEPSNIRPSSRLSSSMAEAHHGQVLPLALGIGEAKVDPFDSSSLMRFTISAAVDMVFPSSDHMIICFGWYCRARLAGSNDWAGGP
jgi:hypothetical protein